jgi:hypothetical protein
MQTHSQVWHKGQRFRAHEFHLQRECQILIGTVMEQFKASRVPLVLVAPLRLI